jgi:hypothetical protein
MPEMRSALVAVAVSLILSCHGGFENEPCTGVTCSSHGVCAVVGGDRPICVCDIGFRAEALECVADSADGDGDVDVDADVDADADAGGDADEEVDQALDADPELDADPDEGCEAGSSTCVDGELTVCDDGAPISSVCELGCATTEPGRCARVVASNVGDETFDPLAPDVISDTLEIFDTTSCARPDWDTLVQSQADGTAVCVLRTNRFEVPAGARFTVTGAMPLVILAAGEVVIAGTLDVSARGATPGPGGGAGGVEATVAGGTFGGGAGAHVPGYLDGGGGGGGLCGAGGSGGTVDDASGGVGGASRLAWDLAPLAGGSGGGSSPGSGGDGGAGGGGLQISSAVVIVVSGSILAGGGGGREGLIDAANAGGGGGGGSGGAVLLEAGDVRFELGGSINVGGGGGGGGSFYPTTDGEPGQDGADSSSRALAGQSRADGADAGDGGGGTDVNGGSGLGGEQNAGGGGGGAGCILIRTASGALPDGAAASNPSVSPSLRALPVNVD